VVQNFMQIRPRGASRQMGEIYVQNFYLYIPFFSETMLCNVYVCVVFSRFSLPLAVFALYPFPLESWFYVIQLLSLFCYCVLMLRC